MPSWNVPLPNALRTLFSAPALGFLAALAAAACSPLSIAHGEQFEARYAQVYAHRASGDLKADLYIPAGEGPFPGVLVVHGGAWRMGTRAQLAGVAQRLARRGYVAAAISYRLAPEHPFPAQIDDCREAVCWLRAQAHTIKLDPDRLAGFGYSAGAQLVSLLGALPAPPSSEATLATENTPVDGIVRQEPADGLPPIRLKAVVAGGAPCDFREVPLDTSWLAFWLGGTRREAADRYLQASPAAFVSADDPPMFFFHGAEDRLVPLESPQKMCESLRATGVEAELYVAPRLGHMAAAMDPLALHKALLFLDRHLQSEPAP